MNMTWTPEAKAAAQQACTDDNVELIDAAIAYAELLADHARSRCVDDRRGRRSHERDGLLQTAS